MIKKAILIIALLFAAQSAYAADNYTWYTLTPEQAQWIPPCPTQQTAQYYPQQPVQYYPQQPAQYYPQQYQQSQYQPYIVEQPSKYEKTRETLSNATNMIYDVASMVQTMRGVFQR